MFPEMYDEIQARTRGTSWRMIEHGGDGEKFASAGSDLTVIWSIAVELDHRPWLHVSAARQTRMPSYLDMVRVKEIFVGPDRFAYSVWAPRSEHISIHNYCLHLWAPLDGDPPLPDFTRGLGTI